MSDITYISRDDLNLTVTFLIADNTYQYTLRSTTDLDNIEWVAQRIGAGKALAAAKRRATRTEKNPSNA